MSQSSETPPSHPPAHLGLRSFGAPVLLTGIIVAAVVVVATAGEMAEGQHELAAADAAGRRSDWPEAIRHARSAAEAFVPASPWPERGERGLAGIGHEAEKRGDAATALLAYGAIRTAALATQAPGWTHARWREEAEAGLARVAGWETDDRRGPAAAEPKETAQSMRDMLAKEPTPSIWTFAALSACAIAFLGGLGWRAWAAPRDRRTRFAETMIAAALVTYAVVLLTN